MTDLAAAIRATSGELGVNPLDLATVISYETGGTFDPWKVGPTTQWGQHRGLIQWGEPQRQKYGVRQDMPVADQVKAAGAYLRDAGVQPGMGLLDLYSAVNAGRVGRYNASDANNGGAPGTVRDKVEKQMFGHRQKAAGLLGDMYGSSPTLTVSANRAPPPSGAQAGAAPVPFPGAAPATPPVDDIAEMFAMAAVAPPPRVDVRQEQAERAKAEKARRLALFGAAGLGGLYG